MKCVAKVTRGRRCHKDRVSGLKLCIYHLGYIDNLEKKIREIKDEIKRVRVAE